ncbi:hypothetical protein [Pedobacter aquatilis]|uniref:hypothetical protein n=1 Tax=Pedobacter aquatilis TaxID=351343 RepID=UPI0025B3708E|nr:hypothetical protein [Pedobacter aquatilis]
MIEDYAISSKSLYKILKEKGVEHLFHANTVATSITLIKAKSLISRYQVEKDNLSQSFQRSDEKDKKYDVWDHIYLDGTDHHKKYSQSNFYGPVLFIFDLELLASPSFPKVHIMRTNPHFWTDNTTEDEKFYNNIDDVNENYLTKTGNDAQIMFTFRHRGYDLKLNKYLHAIGIDEPKIILKMNTGDEMNAGDYIRTVIKKAMEENGIGHIPLLRRHQKPIDWCRCHAQYNWMYHFNKNEFRRRFSRIAIENVND